MFCPRCHRHFPPGVAACPSDATPLIERARVDRIRTKPSQESGAIIGDRYAIKGLIGTGAMARVYLAEDLLTTEPVAIKIMHKDRALDEGASERFVREARAAQRVEHPNVNKIYDAGERGNGEPYLVIEYLFGESLGDLLRRDYVLDKAFALPMIRMAAAGLGAAHRAGVVHRDVKPDNLFLVGERGAPYTIKIVDFGLAKLSEGALTATGVAVGTLEYMSPEQAVTDPVDARTDVYSFGVVMYRMLTGRLPFDAPEDVRLLASHLIVPPRPPTSIVPDLDPRLERVILTALRKHPDNRYRTMDALVDDLEAIQRDEPLPERPLARDPDKFAPRGPLGLSALPAFYRAIGMTP
jgi:serine/threonine-protein kinase